MEKPKSALVWLTLFSLLTAGFGQAVILTAAPVSQGQQSQNEPFHTLSSLTRLSAVIPWTCQLLEGGSNRQR